MDLSSLPRNMGDENPSGDNLEYDEPFMALKIAAQPREERQKGDEVIAAEEPDFKKVISLASDILERSNDLRAACYLAHARLQVEGMEGFADVLAYVRRSLTEFWESCHPQLDPEDDNDPTMRVNAVRNLADPATVLRGLRLATMARSRTFGEISLRDILIAEGAIPAPAGVDIRDAATIAAAFRDSDPAELSSLLDSLRSAASDADGIVSRFDDKVPGQGPDLGPLTKLLRTAIKHVEVATGAEDTEHEGDAPEEAADKPAGGASGAIGGPRDVIALLDRIMQYYERQEPSSPIPILLARAKRLVNADFMTIMRDLAPSGLENVNTVGGLQDDD